jgi:hypothetical protein
MSVAEAVIKGGELLLPHHVGCGAEVIGPDDPRYPQLVAGAIRDEDLNGTPEEDAAFADRWSAKWALQGRRTA